MLSTTVVTKCGHDGRTMCHRRRATSSRHCTTVVHRFRHVHVSVMNSPSGGQWSTCTSTHHIHHGHVVWVGWSHTWRIFHAHAISWPNSSHAHWFVRCCLHGQQMLSPRSANVVTTVHKWFTTVTIIDQRNYLRVRLRVRIFWATFDKILTVGSAVRIFLIFFLIYDPHFRRNKKCSDSPENSTNRLDGIKSGPNLASDHFFDFRVLFELHHHHD